MINYIPGTNKKYSINIKGIVRMLYRVSKTQTITKCNKIVKHHSVSHHNKPEVVIKVEGKLRKMTIDAILYEVYGFKTCSGCNSRIEDTKGRRRCDSCLTKHNNERSALSILLINKNYSACQLKISVEEISYELHQAHKFNLEIKRTIKAKSNEGKALQGVK